MSLFIAHTGILLAASYAATRGLAAGWIDRILACLVLAWANIVATSLLLAGFERLGEPGWYFRTSLLLAIATWLLLRRLSPAPAAVEAPSDRPHPGLLALLLVSFLPLAWASLQIAVTYEPNNYDSLAYHLPRAMYYLGQGDLAHFDTGNPRQIYFPFNYNLLQAFALIYSPPLQTLNFINLAAWATAGLALYRLVRLAGLGVNAALLATWLTLTSTQIFAQATATTNDLPTGAGLLMGLVFGLRWTRSHRRGDALLAGLAGGLTLGSKLTVLFFGPGAVLLLLGIAWQQARIGQLRSFFTGVRGWIAATALAFAFASPFAIINLAEKGEWINTTYDFTLNRPFSFASMGQTAQAYLVQLFLEPLHRFTHDLNFTAELNAWGARTFFPDWNEAYAFSPLYLFPPDLNEDHVWFGLTGPAIFLAGLFCLVRARRFPSPIVWLAIIGLGWFVTNFGLNKWSLYNQRYFVPAILVLGPCLAAVLETGWNNPRWRRTIRAGATLLIVCSVWLAGIYLMKNSSRPYAPLWAGQTPPPALPTLPPLMQQRLAEQTRINIHSTDGNERIFLLMTHGRHQRFTAFAQPVPDAYNVFSEWGFVRKVAYTNIEQLSSYTVVEIPSKQTAGVEFLGTIGSGQPALDYYGLLPHADMTPSSHGNRNVLVELYYAPREPNRYQDLRLRVIGLHEPDQARLHLGVDYVDGTTERLATFAVTGEARASVTRPFHRFTVRVEDHTGVEIGAIDIPSLFRDRPPEDEAPQNPATAFSDQLIDLEPKTLITTDGLASAEGPYPQWNLPLIRWVKAPVLRLDIPVEDTVNLLEVSFDLRLQSRDAASIDVVFNGELVQNFSVAGRTTWMNRKLKLTPRPGNNVLEFRNVVVGRAPDWLDYLERYPDVKAYVLEQNIPLEEGARAHWETHGKHETRVLNLQRRTETISPGEPFYFMFRSLMVEGYRQP